MSNSDEPRILTDQDGHALAVVSGGELHPVVRLAQRVPGQTLGPWTEMSQGELLLAMSRAGEAIALYQQRVEAGEELGTLLAHTAGELTDIEDELIRRGFSQPDD